MTFKTSFTHPMNRVAFAPQDDGGVGNPPADPPVTPPVGDPPAAAPATPPEGDPPADPPADAGKWWEGDKFSDDQRTSLTALGLTVEDPLDAVARLTDMEANAKKRLGAKPDDLMTRPKEGQDVSEWLRENGTAFGIPESAEGYEVTKPEDWPKDAPWNDALEAKAREAAHAAGVSGTGLNAMVGLFAQHQLDMVQGAETTLAEAQTQMRDALEADWGDQTDAKLAQAKQALSVISEKAGLDNDAQFNLLETLGRKGGDANAWKFMSTIAGLMAEDGAAGLLNGSTSLGTTPADARAELEKLRGPDGEYGKAYATNNRAEMDRLLPTIERLSKLAAR